MTLFQNKFFFQPNEFQFLKENGRYISRKVFILLDQNIKISSKNNKKM